MGLGARLPGARRKAAQSYDEWAATVIQAAYRAHVVRPRAPTLGLAPHPWAALSYVYVYAPALLSLVSARLRDLAVASSAGAPRDSCDHVTRSPLPQARDELVIRELSAQQIQAAWRAKHCVRGRAPGSRTGAGPGPVSAPAPLLNPPDAHLNVLFNFGTELVPLSRRGCQEIAST